MSKCRSTIHSTMHWMRIATRSTAFGRTCLFGLVIGGLIQCGHAAETDERDFFENKIRPALVKHCYQCHSADSENIGGGLLLDSRDSVREGGQSGPAIVAGEPDESLLIQAIRYDHVEMPPDNPLPEAVVNDFVTWVRRGANDPRVTDEKGTASKLDAASLWSFLPRIAAAVPEVNDHAWPLDPLDRFVLSRIESAGLRPTHDASAETLIRRLYFDLIGLPPTIQQIDSFADEHRHESSRATARLVDSLLESPQFGERWGRHWLDVARFGESNGDDGLGRNASFPNAWRYRDYVIDAFNDDVPYDQFLTEQIAGDLLPADNAAQRNRQLIATGFLAIGSKPAVAMNTNFPMDVVDDQINAVCTAVMGLSVACARCHDHKHDPIPTRDYYAMAGFFTSTETLYGTAANEKLTAPPTPLHSLTSVWKSEASKPISRKETPRFPDHYSAAIDESKPLIHARLDSPPTELSFEPDVKFSPQLFAEVKTANLSGKFTSPAESYSVAFWFRNHLANDHRPITAYIFSRAQLGDNNLPGDHIGIGGNHDAARTGKLFIFNGNVNKTSLIGETIIPPNSWNHAVMVRDAKQVKLFLNGTLEIEGKLEASFGDSLDFCLANRSDKFAPLEGNLAEFAIFQRALSDAEAARFHDASGQPRGVRSSAASLGMAMGVRDKDKPADCKIHIGGENTKLGDVVPRGWLTAHDNVVSTAGASRDSASNELRVSESQSGRRELAAWLTRPDHPQTARVMVNRIWLHLFGKGIVATPDDFGVYGARPTSPELLDHLAERFVQDNWSIKPLIRAIVLSRTYQLDSQSDAELIDRDSDDNRDARHDRRRLDAESIRDRMLHASGQLELTPGKGSAIATIDALINKLDHEVVNLHPSSAHRSIYLCYLRNSPPPELAAFDLPDGISVMSQRDETTLPTQSLYLLNNPFVVEQSRALAADVLSVSSESDSSRVLEIFRRVLQRNPSDLETQRSLEHVTTIEQSLEATDATSTVGQRVDRRVQAWASLTQALFATNEFRYFD